VFERMKWNKVDISLLLMMKITGCCIRQNECTVCETKKLLIRREEYVFFYLYCKNSQMHMHVCFCLRTVKSVLVLEANNTQPYFNLFINSVHLHNTHFSTSCFLPATAAGATVALLLPLPSFILFWWMFL